MSVKAGYFNRLLKFRGVKLMSLEESPFTMPMAPQKSKTILLGME